MRLCQESQNANKYTQYKQEPIKDVFTSLKILEAEIEREKNAEPFNLFTMQGSESLKNRVHNPVPHSLVA